MIKIEHTNLYKQRGNIVGHTLLEYISLQYFGTKIFLRNPNKMANICISAIFWNKDFPKNPWNPKNFINRRDLADKIPVIPRNPSNCSVINVL